jgi:hypothetical protein
VLVLSEMCTWEYGAARLEANTRKARKGLWGPPRKPREQARESREEVEKKLEGAANQVFAEFTRRCNAASTWQESFTRSPVWTMKEEDRLIPASLWSLTRSRKFKQETTARQVHLDSGTYRNGAGPTHFHQFGILLFLRL